MTKLIATILIIAIASSLIFGILFFKPKKAKAFLGIGDITIDIVNQVKDWIVDQIPRRVARHMMVRLQQEIARWAQGGFSDENKPFAMTSWKQEITDALNISSGRFIQEFGLTPLCGPIRVSLNTMFDIGLRPYGRVPYTDYAACTIGDILGERGTVTEFFENPSIGVYGWDTWTALTQSQNNIFGSFFLAIDRQAEIESEEIAEKEMQKDVGQGYKPEQDCINEQSMTEEQMEQCRNNCWLEVDPSNTQAMDFCLAKCDAGDTGICLEYRTKNLGSTIHSAVEKSIGSDIDWLISADEITEMFNLVFSGLFNKMLYGTGLSGSSYTAQVSQISKYQAQYGYYDEYKKTQTSEDIKNLKRDILDNILQAIKRISTNSYECDKKYQLKGDVFSEVAAEILDQESQHLYSGTEGINLKPDYQVLDESNAVKNGIAVYGETWDDIDFKKYPPKCEKIAGMKCSEILTENDLPYALEIEKINPECTTSCLSRINEEREKCGETRTICLANCENEEDKDKKKECKTTCRNQYTICENDAITTATNERKCSSFSVGNACLQGAHLISKTKNRCNECVDNAQKLCESKTGSNKESCIELYCSNYEDISPSIISANDFYGRCKLRETKNSCNVCLKEYFMPANYCGQISDFINRSFVKYPAQVYEDMWWGGFNKFEDCANNRSSTGKIPVGLTCRILPDFVFPGGDTCESLCNVTAKELKNTADNKPGDLDCNPREWQANAVHPGGQYIPFLVTKRTKCCPALTGNNPELYKKCRGIIGDVIEVEPEETEICHDGKDGRPDEGEKGWAALTNMSLNYPNRAFNDLIWYGEAYANHVILRSNRDPNRGATVYITKPYCDAKRVYPDGTIYESDINDDGKFDDEWVDDSTFEGEFLGYCKRGNKYITPPADKIICEFDLDKDVVGTKSFKDCGDKLSGYSAPTKKGGLWMVVQYSKGGAGLCVKE